MKNLALAMIFLLLSGIFVSSFALAEEISIEDISSLETNTSEIQESLNEINQQIESFKKVGFAEMWRGNGWINNKENGFLIHGYWINQDYTKTQETQIENFAFGKIKIERIGTYSIVKNNEKADSDRIEFYLLHPGTKVKPKTIDNNFKNFLGKLFLQKEAEYGKLVIWKGTLILNPGESQETYEVSLATLKNQLRPTTQAQQRRVSFWKKVQFWKKITS